LRRSADAGLSHIPFISYGRRHFNLESLMALRVLHVGLGPIGTAVARQIASRKGFIAVGAVDIDPGKVGKDLGEVAGVGRTLRVPVSSDLEKTIRKTKPDAVVLCTSSALEKVVPQIESILKHKTPIVSTTEELSYPFYSNKRLARRLDKAAKQAGVAVLGTGVNPGFVMDALPITLTGVCEHVERVFVDRVQDARIRRLPFQQKIGSGLTPADFQARVDTGTVRHVGLTESVAMIADALGWKLDRITDEIAPKIARKAVSSQFLSVKAGQVCGLIQDGVGYRDGKPVITLHMEAYLGAPESYDRVRIEGSPALDMKLAGGVHGDVATASITVNSIPKVIEAPPGLHTMRSLPIPSFAGR
jgi:4-hydroxy-tetrahydrodipicolinate reductase